MFYTKARIIKHAEASNSDNNLETGDKRFEATLLQL